MSRETLVAVGGFCVSALLLGLMIASDFREVAEAAASIRWAWLPLALAAVVCSYALMGLAQREILRVLDWPLPAMQVMGITLISATINYFISSGGVSGFALKAHLLRRRDVPWGVSTGASVVLTVMMHVVMTALMLVGALLLLLTGTGSGLPPWTWSLGLPGLLLVAFLMVAAFFNHELRSRWSKAAFHYFNRLFFAMFKREIPREPYDEFERQLDAALRTLHERQQRLGRAVALTFADWIFMLAALDVCMRAVGIGLHPGVLIAGFGAAQLAFLVPFLPAGLGAMEGIMAAVYASDGGEFGPLMVGLLLFRCAYYLLPGLASLFLFWGLRVSEPSFSRLGGKIE